MSKNAIPALVIVGAAGYLVYKARPDSKLALAIKKAWGSLQGAVAAPQPAPTFALPDAWSDKATSLYLERPSPAPDPPKISGSGVLRDSQALRDVLNIGTDYSGRVNMAVIQDFPGA